MFEWLFSRQAPPADNPTDHVIPSRFWDSSAMVPDIVMRGIARFDDILDPEKLHDSLDRLLSRDDGWGRLGGRLRKNVRRLILILNGSKCRLRSVSSFFCHCF